MRWQRATLYVLALLASWAALAAWQQHEYGHECRLAREMLVGQAKSVTNALVGGIRSHRRLGRFLPEQLQVALDESAGSKDILAAGIVSEDGRLVLTTKNAELLNTSPPFEPGDTWDEEGFRCVKEFPLEPDLQRSPGGPGGGRGGGQGGGQGRGRGPRWQRDASPQEEQSPFSAGGRFVAILLLDRTPTDDFCRRALWLRVWVVVTGGLVLVCVGLAWLATVWWVEARGRAHVLETEARHWRDLSQAAAGLAHETRNPLGLVRGWAQRLAESGLGSLEQQRQIQSVVEECDRVVARINQFLAFAKPCQPKPEPVAPDRVFDELAVLLDPDLDAKGLTLRHSVTSPSRTIQADREMLRQALFNLIQNAVQFAPEKGAVEVAVRAGQDGYCRIEVADRGPGVPGENVNSLFTPYFTTRPNGTGLGLAIVHRIAVAHGWEVGYTPRPGGGSIFWLDRIHG